MKTSRNNLRAAPLLRSLLWIGALILGAGCAEPSSSGDPSEEASSGASDTSDVAPAKALAFSHVTEEAGLGVYRHYTGARGEKWMPETMGSGAAFLDYDGDGRLDIVLVGGGVWDDSPPDEYRALWVYRNRGDGTFEERTEAAGLAGVRAYGSGLAAADYDSDGDTDLFLAALNENHLFENRNGRFVDVSVGSGLEAGSRWSTSALFFDADRDGHLDLYVGNYVAWTPETNIECTNSAGQLAYCTPILYEGVPGRYYHNDGDGTFTDRSQQAGFLPAPGKTLGVAETDFNRDGRSDLVVANDIARNLLYVNLGDGRFEERGMASGIALDRDGLSRSGMGIDVGVVDSTGEVSIFVGNFSRETMGVFRHRGGGLFADRAAAVGIARESRLSLTFGLFLFDPDLDGDLDLFAANGHIRPSVDEVSDAITYRQRPHLFVNRGDGTFADRAGRDGPLFPRELVGRGAAFGDYDGDGDQDVLVTEAGGGAHLWRNDRRTGNVLRVSVEGRGPGSAPAPSTPLDGLGTAVEAVIDGRRLYRRVRTGSSYMSQSENTVTLGLGSSPLVDTLLIRWPSGRVERFAEVGGGQSIHVREGRGIVERTELSEHDPPS